MNSWGNVLDLRYDFHLGTGDNGNVYGITHYGHQTRNQTFTYDALSRLTSAQNAGTDCTVILPDGHTEYWGNSYSYDAWGNLLGKAPTKCSAENLSVSAAANNQLQGGYAYDAAGNMMHDATANLNYTYDQENRIMGAAGFTYTYDADGNRVEKANGTTGTLYWYMSPGIVGESDLTGNLQSEYVFFDGERVARKDYPGNAVSYYFSDHLKTASVITDAAGNIKSESDYYPWGGELQFTNNDSNHYKFTGKERDVETGLDYFGARHYSNGLGRFITPDWSASPVPIPYADLSDPQSFNEYSYVRNVPTSKTDIDGHWPDLPSWSDVRDFALGVANAWGSDNTAGVGRVNQGNFAYHLGQVVGDGAAVIQGTSELAVGGAGEVGGTGLILTGAGAPAGVAVDVGSAAVIVHGAAVGGTGAVNLGRAVLTAFSGKRQGDFKPSEREQSIKENAEKNGGTNKCERCGQEVVRTQNKPGQKSASNQLHVHHDPPIHKGGGRHSKGEVVCRDCHVKIHKEEK
jgi:RHS repeat-associated protein